MYIVYGITRIYQGFGEYTFTKRVIEEFDNIEQADKYAWDHCNDFNIVYHTLLSVDN